MKRPVPPGEVLQEQLEELKLSASKLAKHLHLRTAEVTELLKGEREITPVMSERLGEFFGTTSQFWLALQSNHDEALAARLKKHFELNAKIRELADELYEGTRYMVLYSIHESDNYWDFAETVMELLAEERGEKLPRQPPENEPSDEVLFTQKRRAKVRAQKRKAKARRRR